jgi:hypothetical protein
MRSVPFVAPHQRFAAALVTLAPYRRFAAALVGIGVLGLYGCAASRQYFEPAERVQGQTVQGDKVAIYPLAAGGSHFGEAKVWSHGAYETEDERSVVHVAIEIHNTGNAPIELRPSELRLDVMDEENGPLRGLQVQDGGARVFAPGTIDDTSFLFELPGGITPRDVVALRLHWRVHAGAQRYAQRTPFVEERERQAYAPATAYGGYPCWPYGPYDCMYMYPYGSRLYEPVRVPHRVPVHRSPSRSVVRPKR